jgi:hypothetical protein
MRKRPAQLAAFAGLVVAFSTLADPRLTSGAGQAPTPVANNSTEPKLVLSQWLSLYLARKKIGYVTQSLYELPDCGRRLQSNLFLKKSLGADRAGYFKIITADVDARFRPRALECRVSSGDRQWQVTGQVEDGELVLVRTLGDASTTARIPLDEDVTFLSWTLPATLLSASPGDTRRWLAVDESLGALTPDPCLVRLLGPRTLLGGPGTPALSGTAAVWVCGPQQAAYLADPAGKTLRGVWQSTPLVAEGTSLTEAMRLKDAPDGPDGPVPAGFEGGRYHDARRGFSLWMPPYPFITHASPETGAVRIADLTDEVSLEARLVAPPVPGAAGAPPAASAGASAPLPAPGVSRGSVSPEDDDARLADLVQHEWAARYDQVAADPVSTEQVGGREAHLVEGTARLGCTTHHFKNFFFANEGRMCFLSATVADRPVTAVPVLLGSLVPSLRLTPPEGPLPLVASGDVVRSPYYGFELRRPGPRWGIPVHLDGPMTVLELARQDQAALVLVRVMSPKPGQSLEAFAAEQGQLAAENLDVPRPEPKATALGGQPAVEIAYEGKKILSGRPALCVHTYTKMDSRVLVLVSILAGDADASAAQDLKRVRDSFKFTAK